MNEKTIAAIGLGIIGLRLYGWQRKVDIENKSWVGTAFWKLGATEVDGKGVEPGETYCELCDLATPGDNLRRLNPDGNAWEQDDVDALEIGVRSLAAHGDTWKVSSLLVDVAWTPLRRMFVQVV